MTAETLEKTINKYYNTAAESLGDGEPDGVVADSRSYTARVAGRSPLEVGTAFVEHVRRTPPDDAETALLTDALDAARLALGAA